MTIEVTRMTEADIDGAIDTIQQAFENDPYNRWVYPDRSKVPLHLHLLTSFPTTNPPPSDLTDTQPRFPYPALPLGY